MRYFLMASLFLVSFAHAENLRSRVHECRNESGALRRLELQSSPRSCRVFFTRLDGGDRKVERDLALVETEIAKCEAEERAYLTRMKTWGVSCRLVSERTVASDASTEAPNEVPVASTAPAPTPAPTPAPPPPAEVGAPAKVYENWQGSYASFLLGGLAGKGKTKTGSVGYNADDQEWDYGLSGLNLGVGFGYNLRGESWVVGPDFEIGYLGLKGEGAQPDAPGGDTLGKNVSDLYLSLRLRGGFVFGQSLVYVTGGLLNVNNQVQLEDACNVAPCGGTTVSAEAKSNISTTVYGLGFETLIKPQWSAKIEYLVFSLKEQSMSGTTNLGDTYDWTAVGAGSALRLGFNYHFE